jgi:hypothetical protein
MCPTCLAVAGAPRWKGITLAADVEDPLLSAGCTMTWVAVMVVPLVVPRAKTGSPTATTLADVWLAARWKVVAGPSLTVTCWPAEVVSVKLDVDNALTVPTAPPNAGPDRALPGPPAGPAATPLALAVGAGFVAEDAATPTETPVAVRVAATAATTHRPRLLDIKRR